MTWFKLVYDNEIVGAEAIEEPVYVHRQVNGVIDACNEAHAQGVVSADGSVIYQLDGRASLGADADLTAVEISGTEYDTIVYDLPDPEDTEPEVPEGETPEHIPTRAELAQRVETLEEGNADMREALNMILNGVTE